MANDVIVAEFRADISGLKSDMQAVQQQYKAAEIAGVTAADNVAKASVAGSQKATTARKEESEAVKALKAQLAEVTEYEKKLAQEASNTAPGKVRNDLNKKIAETRADLVLINKELEKEVDNSGKLIVKNESLKKQYKDLQAAIATATDPKDIERLSKAAGTLRDRIDDAKDASNVFASESKFEQLGNALGSVGGKLANLDFKGAADQSKLLVSVVQSISFKDVVSGAKDLVTSIFNVGKALLGNPLFLLAATLTAVAIAAYQVGKGIYEINVQTLSVTNALSDGQKAIIEYKDRFAEAQIKIKESLGLITKAQAEQQRGTIAINQDYRKEAQRHAQAVIDLAKELNINLKYLDENGNATRSAGNVLSRLNDITTISRFNKEKAKLDADHQHQLTFINEAGNADRAAAEIAANQDRAKAANEALKKLQDDVAKKNEERLAADRKLNDDILAEEQRLQTALRNLRTANIINDYDREKQLLFDKFEDDKKANKANSESYLKTLKEQYDKGLLSTEQYADDRSKIINGTSGEQAAIQKELQIKLTRDLQLVDDKYFGDKVDLQKKSQQQIEDEQVNSSLRQVDNNKNTLGEFIKNEEEANKKIEESDKERAKNQQEIDSALLKAVGEGLADISQIQQNQFTQQIQDAQDTHDERIAQLDDELAKKLISQDQYNEKKKQIDKSAADEESELKRKAFEAQKQASIIATIINTATAVVAQLANPTPYVGFILAALAAASGAAQIAVIESQPTPKFAKGVVNLKGKGTSTSDEIPAMLSVGESVVIADSTKQYGGLLAAMNKKQGAKFIQEFYIAPALRAQKKRHDEEKEKSFADSILQSISLNNKFYDGNLLDSLKASRRNNKEIALFMVKELKNSSHQNARRH